MLQSVGPNSSAATTVGELSAKILRIAFLWDFQALAFFALWFPKRLGHGLAALIAETRNGLVWIFAKPC